MLVWKAISSMVLTILATSALDVVELGPSRHLSLPIGGGAVVGRLAGVAGEAFGFASALGVALGHAGELLDRGAGLLDGSGLLAGARRETLAGAGYLTGGGDDLFRAAAEGVGDDTESAIDTADDEDAAGDAEDCG